MQTEVSLGSYHYFLCSAPEETAVAGEELGPCVGKLTLQLEDFWRQQLSGVMSSTACWPGSAADIAS